MKSKTMFTTITFAAAAASLLCPLMTQAAPLASEAEALDFSSTPPLLTLGSVPLVMLGMSVDHELSKKAYSDFSDLNGDGSIDRTYLDTFAYEGYFDSGWCYTHDGEKFTPVSEVVNGTGGGHKCGAGSGRWSGNFLNWSTMTRIDVIRKVLYGGRRSVDLEGSTVLQRAYLPLDAHAFAKTYSGDDIDQLTPYSPGSNKISLCNATQSLVDAEPKVIVARGSWPRWALNKDSQCSWRAWGSGSDEPSFWADGHPNPYSVLALATLTVNVERCVGGDAATTEDCKTYTSAHSKPVGLLQTYGEQGNIKFGLISGSYASPASGGVLRKNVGMITDEIDVTTGVFNDSNNLTPEPGIIASINRFAISQYNDQLRTYDDCTPGAGDADDIVSISSYLGGTTRCSDWGNPLAEIYLEALRYFAGQGAGPTTAFSASADNTYIAGLTNDSPWLDPFTISENECSSCAIIMLSSGMNSFDTDELTNIGNIAGLDITSATNAVGNNEMGGSFSGNDYILKNDDGHCIAQAGSSLSVVEGVCPDVPNLQGGYQIAGLAHHAKVDGIRQINGATKTVSTYAVQMSETVPTTEFLFGTDGIDGVIGFQPACESTTDPANNNKIWQSCSLTHVEVAEGSTDTSGSLLFYWEDSLWGNDYNVDAVQSIAYGVDQTSKKLTLTNGLRYANTNKYMRFSYAVSGTGDDGLVEAQGNKVIWIQNDASNQFDSFARDNYLAGTMPATNSGEFFPVVSTSKLLESPLWYAAKYGGFTDLNEDGWPDAVDEWDAKNNVTGEYTPDGLPDNYFESKSLSQLGVQLGGILNNIVSRTTSGTNAAVVSSSNTGVGAIYQALYQPRINYGSHTVTWSGYMHSLFIDGKGRIREDSNPNARLDTIDNVVKIFFDPAVQKTLIQRQNPSTEENLGLAVDIDELKPIWDARVSLSYMSNDNARIQRPFSDNVGEGPTNRRYLLTSLDTDPTKEGDELTPFTAGTFIDTNNFNDYLSVPADEAEDLVNYIRGDDSRSDYRSRTIDFRKRGQADVWRLGDVIHSTPEIVGAPDGNYTSTEHDPTYKEYYAQYKDRRQMVYVGSNSGMLHAFNGGFWRPNTQGFDTVDGQKTPHALGAEIWGYIPKQALPHLRWLTQKNYPHIYYVDGEPISFDANIFDDDDVHPGGWGTVLVVGMRFGGGPLDITRSLTGDNETMRSGYIVLDVTDPESPPDFIAEITHPDMGYTTSKPTLVKARQPARDLVTLDPDWTQPPAVNKWYLAMGSGPTDVKFAQSNQNSSVLLFDLAEKEFLMAAAGSNGESGVFNSGETASYVGDLKAVDWDGDNKDDVIYFGTTQLASGNSATGNLKRLELNWNDSGVPAPSFSTLLQTDQPITAEPYHLTDAFRKRWVYAGTGRLLVMADNRNEDQQSFYGIKEPWTASGIYTDVVTSDLLDTTDIAVFTNKTIKERNTSTYSPYSAPDGTEIPDFNALVREMDKHEGWIKNLQKETGTASGRNLSVAARLFDTLFFTEYLPPAEQCDIDGKSYMNAIDYRTGTASLMGGFGDQDVGLEHNVLVNRLDIGTGLASAPVIHRGGDGTTHIITQKSTGEIGTDLVSVTSKGGRVMWRQIPKW